MLNRLYIVVGIIAIALLAAAFVVPAFVPWGQFRDRFEAMATDALGAPVRIEGDIHFALLVLGCDLMLFKSLSRAFLKLLPQAHIGDDR